MDWAMFTWSFGHDRVVPAPAAAESGRRISMARLLSTSLVFMLCDRSAPAERVDAKVVDQSFLSARRSSVVESPASRASRRPPNDCGGDVRSSLPVPPLAERRSFDLHCGADKAPSGRRP